MRVMSLRCNMHYRNYYKHIIVSIYVFLQGVNIKQRQYVTFMLHTWETNKSSLYNTSKETFSLNLQIVKIENKNTKTFFIMLLCLFTIRLVVDQRWVPIRSNFIHMGCSKYVATTDSWTKIWILKGIE